MNFQEVASHPFTIGLAVGLGVGFVLLFFALLSRWSKGREFRRYQQLLGDKMKMEGEHLEYVRAEKIRVEKENENLRLKISQMESKPDQRNLKYLEVLARAEQRLMVMAPSFQAAWAQAKSEAEEQMADESAGAQKPRSVFGRMFSGPSNGQPANLAPGAA